MTIFLQCLISASETTLKRHLGGSSGYQLVPPMVSILRTQSSHYKISLIMKDFGMILLKGTCPPLEKEIKFVPKYEERDVIFYIFPLKENSSYRKLEISCLISSKSSSLTPSCLSCFFV